LADSIHRLVRGVMLRYQLWQALGILLIHALVLALVLLPVGAWLPPWVLEPALWVAGSWLGYILLRELVGLLWGRRQLRVADVDSGLRMQDMLTTLWLDRGEGALSAWLRRDVAARLARVPPAHRRRLWWGACRRALLLLPLVALLIWLGPFGSLLPVGLRPGGGNSPSEQVARQPTVGPGQQGPSSKPQAQGEEQAPSQSADKSNQEQPHAGGRPGGDSSPPPGQLEPPKPLIAVLPEQREFVVPTWIHEGPGTKTKAPVVDAPGPGQREPQRQAGRRPGERVPEQPREASPEQQLQQFRRAAERALHARHVPQAERPFVRRYFGELVDGGRGR